jgi:hypothetical protein
MRGAIDRHAAGLETRGNPARAIRIAAEHLILQSVIGVVGDPIFVKRPQLFDQAIIEFFGPLPFEKLDDGRASLQEFGSVPPAAVFRVSERDALRITCVPGIFGLAPPSGVDLPPERWP